MSPLVLCALSADAPLDPVCAPKVFVIGLILAGIRSMCPKELLCKH